MAKKKIVLLTNPPFVSTGLGENGKWLAQYLQKTGKYDLTYYCQQSQINDPRLRQTPWKSIGCYPIDQNILNQLNQDEGRRRWVAYGNLYIDQVMSEIKPDILWCSDDTWAFPDFHKKNWFDKLNVIYHITVDSKPVLPLALEQARSSKHFYTWAKFAADEMKRTGPEYSHVKYIYGMNNVSNFSPITRQEKLELRKNFSIPEKTIIIGYCFRNQLRKEAPNLLVAFKEFKKENPYADVKIHLHTSVSEKGSGWDFPRLIDYYKIDNKDILFTHICKSCKRWEVKPYTKEDLDCPHCGSKGSVITPNIVDSVLDEEMRYIYGLWDASVSPITSGGLEYHCTQSLLCGLPLASTDYSSGEDFCEQNFVYPIKWGTRFEAGTTFIKAQNDINSIKNYIAKINKISESERKEIGDKGRDWAIKTFSQSVIGKQWEDLFDSLPTKDWTTVQIKEKAKNDTFQNPIIESDVEWVKSLYKNILLMDVADNDSGLINWLETLKRGRSREEIYNYFINVAREENGKNQQPVDFNTLLDNTGKKRALFVIKESIGDILICTSLFESYYKQYPNTDFYVATERKFFDLLDGNPYVHKVIEYQGFMESEMACIGSSQDLGKEFFNYYFHPGIGTQRILNYLSPDSIAHHLIDKNEEELTG